MLFCGHPHGGLWFGDTRMSDPVWWSKWHCIAHLICRDRWNRETVLDGECPVVDAEPLSAVFFSDQQNRRWKWTSAGSDESGSNHLIYLFFNLGLLEISISIRSNIDWFTSFLEINVVWDFLSWGKLIGLMKKLENLANSLCNSGLTMTESALLTESKQTAYREGRQLVFLLISSSEVAWMGGASRPCKSRLWLFHWNVIVSFFQLQVTVPRFSNHWTPNTTSNPVSDEEKSEWKGDTLDL